MHGGRMIPAPTKLLWEAGCIAAAVLLVACSAQLVITKGRLSGVRAELATQTAAWATERSKLAETAREATERYRLVEQQRTADRQIAQETRDAFDARSRAAAARSADQLVRLQHALQIAASALRRSPSGDTGPAGYGEAGATAADILGRCASRYRELARRADQSYAAGQQCEQIHDSLSTNQ